MPSIEPGTKNLLINVFTTEPDQQAAGLQALATFGEQMITAGKVPGLISASTHRSTDGTRIVNYAQWQSVENMQAMFQSPEFRAGLAGQPALQHADAHFYEVAGVFESPGARPIEVFRRFQTYLLNGQFDRLPEVVDVDGYTENCVGLTGWTTGLQVALGNFQRNVLAVMSDLAAEELDVVEGPDSLVIRSHVQATHTGTFLGLAATGRRVSWDAVDMYRMRAGKIVWRYLLSDWHAVVQQLT